MPTKSQFLSQTYTLANHVPSVDLGAFDVSLNPKEHRLDVVVRACLDLKDPNSQLKLVKFGERFAKLVPEVWNKRARFVCTKDQWSDIFLEPRFKVEIVGLSSAHFRIMVVDEDEGEHAQGPNAMVTQKTYSNPMGPTLAFAPREATFGSAAVSRVEISSYRRNIIFDLSKSPLMIPIKGTVSADPMGRQRLEKFAREIMELKRAKKFHSSKRPTLTVNGCGPGNRQVVARDVAAFLKSFGVKNPITEAATGNAASPNGVELSFDNAELKTIFPEKPASEKSLFRQITVAHEFGHMLGLPDEYLCMSTKTQDAMKGIYSLTAPELETFKGSGSQIADVKQMQDGTEHVPHIVRHQAAFVKLCSDAGLAPPEFGRMTPSLMSNGMVLHPHHFVTLWEAVGIASGFDDWRIVASS